MRAAQARRVLGVTADADDAEIRRAFNQQLRHFREARKVATDPAMQARLDRALTATVLARRRLLGPMKADRALAATQELPAAPPSRRPAAGPLVLAAGVSLVLFGLFWVTPPERDDVPVPGLVSAPRGERAEPLDPDVAADPSSGPAAETPSADEAPVVEVAEVDSTRLELELALAPEPDAAAPEVEPQEVVPPPELARRWLDPLRLALARSIRDGAAPRLPTRTDAALFSDVELPAGWRIGPQRAGAVALFDDAGRWLLLVPLLEEGELAWLCFARPAVDGCREAPVALARFVQAGDLDPMALADGAADDALARRFERLAFAVGDGRGAVALADRAFAARDVAATMGWLARADAAFEAAGDMAPRVPVLDRLARLGALNAATARETAARSLVDCRDVLASLPSPEAACVGPGELGAELEILARETGAGAGEELWQRARWWYEQGVAERDAYSVRGLARLLALGAAGARDRRAAVALLEEAAANWAGFSETDAASSAAQFSMMWAEGWDVARDASEASWWASQGARLGHVGSALRLAGAFAVGSGTLRNLDRARDLVTVYEEFSPLFEVSFYRNVGQRLTDGSDPDVEADPDAGRAWFRRAFELCSDLSEAGDAQADIELAGMYFSGEGPTRDAARAVELYARHLEAEPVRAGNMIAWIRATHPDPSLRDGEEAVRLALRVVELAPGPDYLDTLAAAHAERGDFDEAVRVQSEALEELARLADPGLAGRDVAERRALLAERLETYRAGRPWRDA
jgi:TPR repeat protein